MSEFSFGESLFKLVEKDMGETARKLLVWIIYIGIVAFVTGIVMTVYGTIQETIPITYKEIVQLGFYIALMVISAFAFQRYLNWKANKYFKEIDESIEKSKKLIELAKEEAAYAEEMKAEARKLVGDWEKMELRFHRSVLPSLAKAVARGVNKRNKRGKK